MIQALAPFAPLFSKRVWGHVQVLLAGTILAPGKRTVTSALRAVGLEEERQFCRYHRVLNRAAWSGKESARVLLVLLVDALVPDGPLVLGIDETLERRRGKKIGAKGVYETRCSRAASASSRRAASDGSVWCFWRRLGGLLGFGHCRFSRRWPTPSVTPKSRVSGTRRS